MTRDTDLIRRGDAISWCDKWIATFGAIDIRHTSAREYAMGAVEDLRDALRTIPVQESPSPGVTAGANDWRSVLKHYRDDLCEGFCKEAEWTDAGHSHPDMQRDCGGCRAAAALLANPTPAPVVPAEGLERAREDEAKAGWALDMELLKELRSAAGDWGYSLDLEAVEQIALAVEARLRSAPPVGARVRPLVWKQAGGDVKPGEAFSAWGHLSFAPTTIYLTRNGWWLSVDCKTYPTLEDAKAAAQADYEARILAALLPAGEGE